MELTERQKRLKIWYEIKDLCTGAAFPVMIQLIFSASVILFADYSGELGLQIAALVLGEILIMGAYVIFGRQNGLVAYRRTVQQTKKREANSNDLKALFHTGEYSAYKGVVTGLISVLPYMVFELIQCLIPNTACGFILKYAFGWAVYPFKLIGEFSEWLNFIWIVVPVGIHSAAYILGAIGEKKRQLKINEAQDVKGRKKR